MKMTRYIVMKITRPLLWSYVYMQFKDNYVADVKEGKRDYHMNKYEELILPSQDYYLSM